VNEARRLRCSFCAAAWDVLQRACVYCGEAGASLTTRASATVGSSTVETCASCRGYIKVIAATGSAPFPLVALSDLESMDLDLLAMQNGCARPAIKQFARR
jgi:FdhE protein